MNTMKVWIWRLYPFFILSVEFCLVLIGLSDTISSTLGQLGFESVNTDISSSEESNSIVVACPFQCLCFDANVRCMSLQLDRIPQVPKTTKVLDLRFNEIRLIPPNSFLGLHQLETLILNDNQIGMLENGGFNGLHSLKYLYLFKNRIRHIQPNAFSSLTQLTHLYLHYNQISGFPPSTFANLTNLERLFLHHNQIQRIPVGLFDHLYKLTRLRLDSNALICDCGMLGFAQMLNSHPGTQAAATCQSPNTMIGKPISTLPEMNLKCRKPTITDEPRDVEVRFGSTVYFSCKADGDPVPKIIWLHNSNEITLNLEPRYSVLNDGTLMIAKASESDVGTFECMATSSVGEAKSRQASMETITVKTLSYRPRFRTIPSDIDIREGDRVQFNCTAAGFPSPIVTWQLNDAIIHANDTRRKPTSQGLVIENVRLQDVGVYQCTASNDIGRVSALAQLRILNPPVWTTTPSEQSIQKGNMVVFQCEATGEPQPTIRWTHNGQALLGDGHRVVLMNNGNQLVIKTTLQEDEGEFGCYAENVGGALEIFANLRIIAGSPPIFTMNSIYTNYTMEDSILRFKCSASGIPPPTIIWRKNGLPLSESGRITILPAGRLLISSFSPRDDSGIYSCSAFNDHGLITSDSVEVSLEGAVRTIRRETFEDSVVFNAITQARRDVELAENDTIEELFGNMSKMAIRNPYDLFQLARFPKAEARAIARSAEIYERALHLISKHAEKMEFALGSGFYFHDLLSPTQLELLSRFSGCIEHQKPRNNCSLEMCFHHKYRTIQGSCNNLAHPMWGSSYTTFQRLLPSVYENGFNLPIGWTPGKLYNGHQLPLARSVSSQIVRTEVITPDDTITHMVMQWGQFLDHDLDHALPSLSIESYGERVSCRRTCSNVAPCFPMQVPDGDARARTRKCMEFTRSASVCGSGITSIMASTIQQREQINQLTSFIDASQVYGSSVAEKISLQNQTNSAFLRNGIYYQPNKPLMPFATDETPVDCRRNFRESDVGCFLGGDIRVNEQLGLLAMHTIWFREHNLIAEEIKQLNPHWLDEVIFQEVRKIIGAQMQHITYAHWLPHVLGAKGMAELGPYKGYDPNVNPTISTEFATAALRFGHTLINPVLRRLDADFESIGEGDLPLRQAFFSPWRLVEEGGLDPVTRGLFISAAKLKKPDQLLNSHLTEELFSHAHLVALDLAAMNIQRSRDHGIQFYNEYRVLCNLTRADTFDDLKVEIPDDTLRGRLEAIYKNVNNIDLWVGGIAEEVGNDGARVGPTFRCILVDQFRRLRDGDRFWYESPSVFQPDQLIEIKQTTLARILCDTGDNLNHVKRDVFLMDSLVVPCSQISYPQYSLWAETESCCNDKSRPTCPPLVGTKFQRRRGRRNSHLDGSKGHLLSSSSEEVEENTSSFMQIFKSLQARVKYLETHCLKNENENATTIAKAI